MSERYLSQDFDFLGSLRERLAGLAGFLTMAMELIQNAEDAQAKYMKFDFYPNSLKVENSSDFRDIDFGRIRSIASGEKKEETGTFGSFGIGFISVYQITDYPEIKSSGKHWRFNPEEDSGKRIYEADIEATPRSTKFIFPWAFKFSKIRERLGIEPINKEEIEIFKKDLRETLPSMLIFLKNLEHIELYNNGARIASVRREGNRDKGKVDIFVNSEQQSWKIYKGEFERPENPQIEEKKSTEVFITASEQLSENDGLLYVFLPTQIETGFPLHFHADFYPTPERKRILFDGEDYRIDWNRRCLNKMADIFANSMTDIVKTFGNNIFFRCLKAAKDKIDDRYFKSFWQRIKEEAINSPIIFTSQNDWKKAADVYLLRDEEEEKYRYILESLGLCFAHSDLRSYWNILTELGSKTLVIDQLITSLEQFNLQPETPLINISYSLNNKENLRNLYFEIDILYKRIRDTKRDEINAKLSNLCLGLSTNKKIYPFRMLKKLDDNEQRVFKFIEDRVLFANEFDNQITFLNMVIPNFKMEDAIDFLKEISANKFLELYTNGSFVPLEVYKYFARNSEELINSNTLQEQFLDIPMFMAREDFRPLKHLSLPGNFKDPLKLDVLIQEKLDGMVLDFLKKLGVSELDLATYSKRYVFQALQDMDIQPEQLRTLVDEFSSEFSTINDDEEAMEALNDCAIIECEDGIFRKGHEVYFEVKILKEILGENNYHYVTYPEEPIPESYRTFYSAIGVKDSPQSHDIIDRIKKITENPPVKELCEKIEKIFSYLSENFPRFNNETKENFNDLKSLEWLPEEENNQKWYRSENIYTKTRDYLFESTGHFLIFDPSKITNEFREFMGLKVEPPIELVIKHLLNSSERNRPIHRKVYEFLSTHSNDPQIRKLREKKCININGNEFIEPNKIFWQDHSFGKYRHKLQSDLREFQKFFQAVGVKEFPETEDYIEIILEISDECGNVNMPLDDQTFNILISCFFYLQQQMLSNKNLDEYLIKLNDRKIIPQCNKRLYPSQRIFLEDKSGIAEKFDGYLQDNIIKREMNTWQIFNKLGVRLLSQAVKSSIYECMGTIYDSNLTMKIRERNDSFIRIIESREKQIPEGWSNDIIKNLEVHRVNNLKINYSVQIESGEVNAQPISEKVFLDKSCNKLYVNYDFKPPYIDIACELAVALNPSIDTSDLGPVIEKVLNSDSPEEAENILDKFRFDKLIGSMPIETPPERTITSIGSEKILPNLPRDRTQQEKVLIEKSNDIITNVESGKKSVETQQEPTRRSRLRSYVLSKEMSEERERIETKALSKEERSKVDDAGMKRAIEFEKSNGRTPERMPHNHEGYDIQSYNDKGEIERYIEVKSTKSKWQEFEVELSHSQFEEGKKWASQYFLYVVDNALDQNSGLYEIQNPACRVDGFLYDRPWADG